MSDYKPPDPKSIATITIDALRNVIGLALGAAVADGHFDNNTRMVIADGIQVHVGDKRFWATVLEDDRQREAGDKRCRSEHERCSDAAGKVVRDTWGGSMTYVVAHVADFVFLQRKDALKSRDGDWRAAVNELLELELDGRNFREQLDEADRCAEDELTEHGRRARDAYRAVKNLLEGDRR